MAQSAGAIDDLIAGKLAPNVDATALFKTDLGSGSSAHVKAVVAMVSEGKLFEQASKAPVVLAPLSVDQAKLAIAQARFLRLPQAKQRQLLARHSEKAAAWRKHQDKEAREQVELADLRGQISQLENFLAGKLVPGGTLAIDLIDDLPDLRAKPASQQVVNLDTPAGLRARLAELRRQVLYLTAERLAELQKASGIGLAPEIAAQLAEDQMREATHQAQNAQSERDRIIAIGQASLYGTRAAQGRFAAALAQLGPESIQEDALVWRRQVRDIEAMPGARASAADALYARLVAHLQGIRRQLDQALRPSGRGTDPAIYPRPLDNAIGNGLVAAPELLKLHRELAASASDLEARQVTTRSREQMALREAMALVNEARLELIANLSPRKRSAVLGFGKEGIAQVSREISQISLDLRYQLANWRQSLDAAIAPFSRPTPSFAFSFVAIVAVTLLFRWWRHHGGALLLASEQALRRRRPRTVANEVQVTLFGYMRRVGAPLDWVIYILLLRWLKPEAFHPVGLPFIWIIATYSVAAWLAARLTNELVRGRREVDPRADLRLKSLSLVIGVSFIVLLALALTGESVGKGAIYNWVLDFCWLLSIPVILLLSHWWRERIVALAGASDGRSSLLGWIARDPGGLPGLIGRAIAGATLLIKGARLVIARRIRDFALVRELFEHRERALAAKRVAEDKASGRYKRPSPDVLEVLDPHRAPLDAVRVSIPVSRFAFDTLAGGTIVALVGERGLGKSAVLQGLADLREANGGTTIGLKVESRGFEGIIADLAAQLCPRKKQAGEDDLVDILIQRDKLKPIAITIDDLQRLVIPAIGGLDELDRLIAFARRCGDGCFWVMAIGAPAWNYVSRARFDRVLFDTVEQLARWSLDELRALIERRTEQTGLVPDFGDMTEMGAYQFDGDLTPEQRKQAAYFDRLSDYANGNPAIALEFWRRSLFIDTLTQKMVVRTFATPDVQKLPSLPASAMFMLRAILQMDSAMQPAIERSTDLSPIIVTDAIRSLERLGVIAVHDSGYRIAMFWWAEVVRALQRQNLIVRF
ncbi:hypothetical protein [Rhizorhapis sp. SPR117]|uniref:hypothetical protein n=1 Tax=Rhizorhapis sp. SPR117 TaxID=2912611 RepID=UPI001F2F6729|nr:hypothetical protein [Rhizorhapis sp. SPR117]